MAWFRQKPQMVEAYRFGDVHATDLVQWINARGGTAQMVVHAGSGHVIEILTLDGLQTAYDGDWIVHRTNGTFAVCDISFFVANYELVREAS